MTQILAFKLHNYLINQSELNARNMRTEKEKGAISFPIQHILLGILVFLLSYLQVHNVCSVPSQLLLRMQEIQNAIIKIPHSITCIFHKRHSDYIRVHQVALSCCGTLYCLGLASLPIIMKKATEVFFSKFPKCGKET